MIIRLNAQSIEALLDGATVHINGTKIVSENCDDLVLTKATTLSKKRSEETEAKLIEAVLKLQAHKDTIKALRKQRKECLDVLAWFEEENQEFATPPMPCWKRGESYSHHDEYGSYVPGEGFCENCTHNEPIAHEIHQLKTRSGGLAANVVRYVRRVQEERKDAEEKR